MKLFFSVLFHESEFSIVDFCDAIKQFYPNSLVLLTLSKSYKQQVKNLSKIENLEISSDKIYSSYSDGTVWFAHLSNINNYFTNEGIVKNSSDRIILCGSNEMYLKPGLEELIKRKKSKGDQPTNNIHFNRCKNSIFLKRLLSTNKILHHVNEGFWFNPTNEKEKLLEDYNKFKPWYTRKSFSYLRKKIKNICRYSVSPKNRFGNKLSFSILFIFTCAFEEIYFPTIFGNQEGQKTTCYMDFSKQLSVSKKDIYKALSDPEIFSIKRIERDSTDHIRLLLRNMRNAI